MRTKKVSGNSPVKRIGATEESVLVPIKYWKDVAKTPDKVATQKFELRTYPDDLTRTDKYSVTVPIFKSSKPEQWLDFLKEFHKVEVGQCLESATAKYSVCRNLLDGEALRVFDLNSNQYLELTVENFQECLNAVTTYLMPPNPLRLQKRYMRRVLKKPEKQTVREYVARLLELNNYLDKFPPFQDNQRFSNEELAEIIEYSMPSMWQQKMVEHCVSSAKSTIDELIDFCERMEFAFKLSLVNNANDARNNQPNSQSKKNHEERSDSKTSKSEFKTSKKFSTKNSSHSTKKAKTNWCQYHRTAGHDMSECKVMIDQANRMHANWETNKQNPNAPTFKKKPTAQHSVEREKTYTRKEVNAMLTKVAKHTSASKRKYSHDTDNDNSTIGSSQKREHFNVEPANKKPETMFEGLNLYDTDEMSHSTQHSLS
jgi:hypothetical protein